MKVRYRVLKRLTELGPDKYVEINPSNSMSIFHLRREIGEENIVTANGVGYRIPTDEGLMKARELLKRVSNVDE